MEAFEALTTRRSVRQFERRPVAPQLLERIMDAGRLAPTARNEQPWEFVVITEAGTRGEIAALADNGRFIAEAPVCIVVLARPTRYYLEDGSAATANMLLAAHASGLGACWVAGDKKPYATQVVSLCGAPADLKLVSMIAIGYPKQVPAPNKRPLQDVIHRERFGGSL